MQHYVLAVRGVDTWGNPLGPSRSPPPGGALTGSSGGRLSFSSSSWEGATPSCWTSAWSWVKGARGGAEVRGWDSPAVRRPVLFPSPEALWALTCTPGARGSKQRGSRSPPGRRLRQRVRTPGLARRLQVAAGSPPRCWGQGRSAPNPCGPGLPAVPSAQCSRPGPPRKV